MLKIFNDLELFFQDNYRRINVREYARIVKISPPSASKFLEMYYKEGLLNKEEDRRYIFYFANKENMLFLNLMRVYWLIKLKEVIKKIEQEFINSTIILFGSLAKGEAKSDSDIDLVVFSTIKKEVKLNIFEKMLGRNIQLFVFKDKSDIKNENLRKNILNGFVLRGRL